MLVVASYSPLDKIDKQKHPIDGVSLATTLKHVARKVAKLRPKTQLVRDGLLTRMGSRPWKNNGVVRKRTLTRIRFPVKLAKNRIPFAKAFTIRLSACFICRKTMNSVPTRRFVMTWLGTKLTKQSGPLIGKNCRFPKE